MPRGAETTSPSWKVVEIASKCEDCARPLQIREDAGSQLVKLKTFRAHLRQTSNQNAWLVLFCLQKSKFKKQMVTRMIIGIGEWRMMTYFGDVNWKVM
jgi:hypothetical protein